MLLENQSHWWGTDQDVIISYLEISTYFLCYHADTACSILANYFVKLLKTWKKFWTSFFKGNKLWKGSGNCLQKEGPDLKWGKYIYKSSSILPQSSGYFITLVDKILSCRWKWPGPGIQSRRAPVRSRWPWGHILTVSPETPETLCCLEITQPPH